MTDTQSQIQSFLKDAEARLSARTVDLQRRMTDLENSHDKILIQVSEDLIELKEDLASQIAELSRKLEDDRLVTAALIRQEIEKKFVSFTVAKVKEVMRQEAASVGDPDQR